MEEQRQLEASDLDIDWDSIPAENEKTRDFFSKSFPIVEWVNPFCYWYKEPEYTDRLTPWDEIQDVFNITSKELELLQFFHTNSNFTGACSYKYLKEYKDRNKTRYLRALTHKGCVKLYHNHVVINPCIMYGRSWYSPFYQGALLAAYMNHLLIKVELYKINTEDHALTNRGAQSVWKMVI